MRLYFIIMGQGVMYFLALCFCSVLWYRLFSSNNALLVVVCHEVYAGLVIKYYFSFWFKRFCMRVRNHSTTNKGPVDEGGWSGVTIAGRIAYWLHGALQTKAGIWWPVRTVGFSRSYEKCIQVGVNIVQNISFFFSGKTSGLRRQKVYFILKNKTKW